MTTAFFDCDPHAETYRHRTEAEAIAGYLDDCLDIASCADHEVRVRFGDAAALIAEFCGKHGPITVMRYEPETLDSRFAERQARWCLERVVENWCDEYGGDHDATDTTAGKALIERTVKRVEASLAVMFEALPVYQCRHVSTRAVLAAEAIAMVRGLHSGWFH